MTWSPVPPWQVRYDVATRTLDLLDPTGAPQARLDPHPPAAPPHPGHLRNLPRRLEEGSEPVVWELGHGRLADGVSAVVHLRDGHNGEVVNGAAGGWRRAHRNGRIHLPGRGYDVTHRGRRRTRLSRDGTLLAITRRPLLRIGRGRADELRRDRVSLLQPLDRVDELALVLMLTVLGPPGRPGWWARLWDEMNF